MALSSSSGIATCRRSIRSGLDVICRIEFSQLATKLIRESRKTHHCNNLSTLMSALDHERTNYAHVELLTFEKDMFFCALTAATASPSRPPL